MANLTTGCGGIPDADAFSVVTKMVQEKGRISSSIYQVLAASNPFIKVLEPTKKFFPSGMGDTLNELIYDIARPKETDVLAWTAVKAASPGYNPCCTTYKQIPYGSRTVSACLYKDGWKTQEFCVVDLSFKFEREKQIRQQKEIMTQWTKDIWSHWSVVSYQRSVQCVTLNSAYGLPEQHGAFPDPKPTSILTFRHLEELYRRIRSEGGELGRTVEGFELVFIGDSEFQALYENYLQEIETLGHRSESIMLPELGEVRRIGKYMFVIMDNPRRFRERAAGETWEDALVPCFKDVEGPHGTLTVPNPDYYNSDIAIYSEFICFNAGAVNWLVPPEAMVNGGEMFPAQNYAGDFQLVNLKTENDPTGKNAYFLAEFMAGMIAQFPKRARAGLGLAVHARYKDVCVSSCGTSVVDEPEKWHVLSCAKVIGASRLQLLIKKGTLPDTCPANHSLFIVSKQGHRYLIDSIVSQEAYTGDAINTEGGTLVVISFPTELAAAATCREECDAWEYVACLPADTPVSDPTVTGCSGCSPNTVSTTCTYTWAFNTDAPLQLFDSDDVALLGATPGGGYTAATLKAAIEAASFTNAASVTVTESGQPEYEWVVQITFSGTPDADLTDAYFTYEDGLYQAQAQVVVTGDCTFA